MTENKTDSKNTNDKPQEQPAQKVVVPDIKPPSQSKGQTFNRLRFVFVHQGIIYVKCKNGERDHAYDLSTAIKRYWSEYEIAQKLFKYGVPGWSDLFELLEDFRAKILEACTQRRSLNMDIPQIALDFEQGKRN